MECKIVISIIPFYIATYFRKYFGNILNEKTKCNNSRVQNQDEIGRQTYVCVTELLYIINLWTRFKSGNPIPV